MRRPFHFAFPVADLDRTRGFYTEILGCRIGRSTKEWIDFDFFGNQISAHQRHVTLSIDLSKQPPIPHFGAVVDGQEFAQIAKRVGDTPEGFLAAPITRFPGERGEQQTMFFHDPDGHVIEIKSMKHDDELFARQEPK